MSPELISLISLIISAISLTGSFVIFTIGRRRENYQNLLQRLSQYYSPEFHIANQRLWNLYREFGGHDFLDKYFEIMKSETGQANSMPLTKRLDFEKSTLHYQRRLVTQFWRGLAILIKNGLVPRKSTFEWWARDDVEIVSKIIIPIENRLADHLKVTRLNKKTEPLFYLSKIKDKFYET